MKRFFMPAIALAMFALSLPVMGPATAEEFAVFESVQIEAGAVPVEYDLAAIRSDVAPIPEDAIFAPDRRAGAVSYSSSARHSWLNSSALSVRHRVSRPPLPD